MILELVAARLIAKHLGSSLYTWTAVIGVVLAGISLGNYLGGRIADRFRAGKALPVIFAVASATCGLTVILNNIVAQLIWLWELSWPVRVFTHVVLVFMIPSTILGMVSPVVAKMALDRGLPSGRTVGVVYAWGTIGSIAGTFVAGYWLIGAIGTVAIIWIIGGVLMLSAILYSARIWPFCICAIVFVCAMALSMASIGWCRAFGAALALREPPDPAVIYRDETAYSDVSIKRISTEPDKREFFEDKLTHSKIVMGDITNLQYFYTKIYAAVTQGLAAGRGRLSVMVIGGGGYVYPRYVEKMWPGSTVDVVEIDPGVTEAAIQAFGLPRYTAINTFSMDARNYVDQLLHKSRETSEKRLYDFIYGDAFSDYSVPFQLLTKEFNDKLTRILSEDGVYMLNLIGIYECGKYLGAVVNTLQKSFAEIHIVTEARTPKWARNTFVVVAAKRKLDIERIISELGEDLRLWHLSDSDIERLREKSAGLVLTDNYAPVDNLLAPVVRQSAKGLLAHRYIQEAQKLAREQKNAESIIFYKKAADSKPELTTITYSEIGFIYFREGNYASAVEAFTAAIKYNDEAQLGHNLARVNFELGVSLENLGRGEEAKGHFEKAAEFFYSLAQEFPDTPEFQFKLGKALVKIKELDGAIAMIERAIELNPDHMEYYLELAKVLEITQRYDRGIKMLKKAIERFEANKQTDDSPLNLLLDVFEFKKWSESRKEGSQQKK
ncbi:MAG: fused MFS/spermidine synthase [Sedimentisphaerales bacterium]|nr:fused MFS/spermidine synthase [Sedimentisphaerales bacterium]